MIYAEHFSAEEFREWADDVSPRLVTMMDILRFQVGSPVIISPHPDSLGRELGSASQSAHNIDYWGEVLAVDFFVSGVYYREQAESVVDHMRRLGFTGIGVYTGTRNNQGEPQVMFHGDVRPTRDMGDPAEWGRINGVMTTLYKALQSVPLGGA